MNRIPGQEINAIAIQQPGPGWDGLGQDPGHQNRRVTCAVSTQREAVKRVGNCQNHSGDDGANEIGGAIAAII